jgi:hypothetical protein
VPFWDLVGFACLIAERRCRSTRIPKESQLQPLMSCCGRQTGPAPYDETLFSSRNVGVLANGSERWGAPSASVVYTKVHSMRSTQFHGDPERARLTKRFESQWFPLVPDKQYLVRVPLYGTSCRLNTNFYPGCTE